MSLAEIKARLESAQSQARGAVALSLDDCARLIRALELAIEQRDGAIELGNLRAAPKDMALKLSAEEIKRDNAAIDKILCPD